MAEAARIIENDDIESASKKLTWKEFKDLCEQHGITDDDLVDDIDISWGRREYFKCEKDEVFGWKISLVSI